MTIPCGPCAKFSLYHLMNLRAGEECLRPDQERTQSDKNHLFPSKTLRIGNGTRASTTTDRTTPPPNPKSSGKTFNAARVVPNPASKNFVPPGTLGALASVLRSKNAGPFEITFDVMFATEDEYNLVKQSGILSAKSAADVLGLPEDDVVWCGYFDPARAFKVTVPRILGGRRVASGSFMEKDVHAAQRYLPLMYMKLPQDLLAKLAGTVKQKGV
jgi:hypothetical protein